jgi:hypothetical protein
MKTAKKIFGLVLVGAILLVTGAVQAADRMAPQPAGQRPQVAPVEKTQMAPVCPDMVVTEIRYEIVQQYPDAPQPMAKVRVTALARNLGKAPFPFSGKLLLFGDALKLGEQAFGTVPVNGEVKVAHELKWVVGSSVGQFFMGKIVYDPAVFKNKYEQDCDFSNNEQKRSTQELNGMISGKTVEMKLPPAGVIQQPQPRPLDDAHKAK